MTYTIAEIKKMLEIVQPESLVNESESQTHGHGDCGMVSVLKKKGPYFPGRLFESEMEIVIKFPQIIAELVQEVEKLEDRLGGKRRE